NRLTVQEASLAEADYYGGGPGHDRDKQIALYEAMLDRGDTSFTVLNNLALAYEIKNDFARAETLLRASVAKFPDLAIGYRNLGILLSREGRWAEIQPVIDTVRSRFPGNPGITNLALQLLYHEGDAVRFEH